MDNSSNFLEAFSKKFFIPSCRAVARHPSLRSGWQKKGVRGDRKIARSNRKRSSGWQEREALAIIIGSKWHKNYRANSRSSLHFLILLN